MQRVVEGARVLECLFVAARPVAEIQNHEHAVDVGTLERGLHRGRRTMKVNQEVEWARDRAAAVRQRHDPAVAGDEAARCIQRSVEFRSLGGQAEAERLIDLGQRGPGHACDEGRRVGLRSVAGDYCEVTEDDCRDQTHEH
jgi:hypothetical protein